MKSIHKVKKELAAFAGGILLIGFCTGGMLSGSCNKYREPSRSVSGVSSGDGGPAVDKATRTWLALGDSYTIGTSVRPEDSYPAQVAGLLRGAGYHFDDPEIIAASGWTTGDLLTALDGKMASTPYDVVSLLIGVNNQYQGRTQAAYRQEFSQLLKQAIQLAGGRPSHVLVLSIPDYSVTAFAAYRDRAMIASQIDSFNQVNNQESVNEHTLYLDVTEESRRAQSDRSLIASDSLHFSGKEYGRWASLMIPLMEQAVSQ